MPILKAGIASATQEAPSTVDGSTVWPPTDGEVATEVRSIDDYVWSDPSAGSATTFCSLNPFWGVRRVTAKELAKSNTVFSSTYQKTQSFNCSLQTASMPNVCVSIALGATARADGATRIVEFPFMTNHVAVEAGEELLMEAEERVVIPSTKRLVIRQTTPAWKDSAKHPEKHNAQSGKNAGQKRKAEKT